MRKGTQGCCLHINCRAAWVNTDAVDCAGFYIIPRSPTEVYYDVSTESVEAQLYNWFYCCNTTSNANCPTSAAPLATRPFIATAASSCTSRCAQRTATALAASVTRGRQASAQC